MKVKKINGKDLEYVVEEAMRGNGGAFDAICEAKRYELYSIALRLLGSPEDAEDAVQETLLAVFQSISKLKCACALNSWLYKILHQRCTDIMRKKKRRIYAVLTDDDIADTVADRDEEYLPEKHAIADELSVALCAAIFTLPEKSRDVLILYYLNGMKYSEIAKATGTSVKTVSTNLLRARRNLRSKLAVAGANLVDAIAQTS
jgi:RNA polymerase sigma-70 factor (ECF subfamily)